LKATFLATRSIITLFPELDEAELSGVDDGDEFEGGVDDEVGDEEGEQAARPTELRLNTKTRARSVNKAFLFTVVPPIGLGYSLWNRTAYVINFQALVIK
jgi:hypothetical protein